MNSELVFGGGEKIEKLIYEIREKQQIVTSKDNVLRSQVGTSNKEGSLRFQFETSKMRGGRRYKTYVFTEQGVAMLATILRTEVASQVSIAIMRAFVTMRHFFDESSYRLSNVEAKIIEHDNSIKLLQESFRKFDEKRKLNEIYFDGQIYDAYYKVLEIFKEAEKSLIIIDAYADNTILNMIRTLDISVAIITRKNGLLNKQDVEKYNKQYSNLIIVYDNTFHDRYFVLDEKNVYHCGASVNRIGYKTFSINQISDKRVCDLLIERIKRIGKLRES